MEITGRLTADATVATTKSEKQVVNFSIAINDRYKTKEGEKREVTMYVDCAYWLSAKAAENLKKGALVQLHGRIGVDAYVNMQGDAVGKLTFHVNSYKMLTWGRTETNSTGTTLPVPEAVGNGTGDKDDLPF